MTGGELRLEGESRSTKVPIGEWAEVGEEESEMSDASPSRNLDDG